MSRNGPGLRAGFFICRDNAEACAAHSSPAEFPPRADRYTRKTDIMIELTRLNGNRLAVNGDLIQFAEAAPDTLLTMVTGEKMLVAESLTEVSERMLAFRARTMCSASGWSPIAFSAK